MVFIVYIVGVYNIYICHQCIWKEICVYWVEENVSILKWEDTLSDMLPLSKSKSVHVPIPMKKFSIFNPADEHKNTVKTLGTRKVLTYYVAI